MIRRPGSVVDWTWGLVVIGGGALIAVGVVGQPLLAAAAVAATVLLLMALYSASRPPRIFLAAVGILLCGYAFFGRAVAYLGVPPVYAGELVLVIGIGSVALSERLKLALRSPIIWLVVAFMVWGAACTIPGLLTYGQVALRDAVVWGYGAFAILVVASLLSSGVTSRVPDLYARAIPWFLVWAPIALLIGRYPGFRVPMLVPSVPIIGLKPGDTAVHLAGAAAFLLLGLTQKGSRRPARRHDPREWGLWALWLVGFVTSASINRGGLLSIVTPVMLLLPFVPAKRSLAFVGVSVGLFCLVLVADVQFNTGGPRTISPKQLALNLQSVPGDESAPRGSREWRLDWWREIVRYTFAGDYFWTGKGYGVNLSEDDGYYLYGLRSPHNGHMTILARSGVPGFVLWLLLQGAFVLSLVREYFRSRARAAYRHAGICLWLLAYWTAFMINASFDVYLEGPTGGVWFWSLIGFGVAHLHADRSPDGGERVGGSG